MHILAVDDAPDALKALTRAVREAAPHARVHAFSDAAAALAFAADTPCRIAFLEPACAGMGGIALAEALKRIKPDLNIIFVADDARYMPQAFALHVSGYLVRPVSAPDILDEMKNLRFPAARTDPSGIYVRTFGNFDLLVDGKPVAFRRSKAKEALAYLVDRRGAGVTRKELASVLFENREYTRSDQNYLTKILKELRLTLCAAGAEAMLVRGANRYAVDPAAFFCDLYAYEKADGARQGQRFRGEYMAQYSWAETSLGSLLWKIK